MANGGNGERDERGRFGVGNRVAVGHAAPHARRVACLRAALLDAVTPEDIREIAKALIERAKTGDRHAIRELFDRVLGAPDKSVWTEDNLASAIHTAINHQQSLDERDLDPAEKLLRALPR